MLVLFIIFTNFFWCSTHCDRITNFIKKFQQNSNALHLNNSVENSTLQFNKSTISGNKVYIFWEKLERWRATEKQWRPDDCIYLNNNVINISTQHNYFKNLLKSNKVHIITLQNLYSTIF